MLLICIGVIFGATLLSGLGKRGWLSRHLEGPILIGGFVILPFIVGVDLIFWANPKSNNVLTNCFCQPTDHSYLNNHTAIWWMGIYFLVLAGIGFLSAITSAPSKRTYRLYVKILFRVTGLGCVVLWVGIAGVHNCANRFYGILLLFVIIMYLISDWLGDYFRRFNKHKRG